MKPTKEEIAARLDAEAKRRKEGQIVDIWRPTITEREKEQRQKDIDAKVIPF